MVAMYFETISRRKPPRKPIFTLERVVSVAFACTFIGVGAAISIIARLQ